MIFLKTPLNRINLHRMQIKLHKMKINRLKTILAQKLKTGKWHAEELGKNESTISRWCTSSIQPSVETMAQIAKLLRVDIRDLFNPTH